MSHKRQSHVLLAAVVGIVLSMASLGIAVARDAQDRTAEQALTPLQLEIEKHRLRLGSGEVEDRREALMRLSSLRHPAASRVALSGLNDPSPMVRATATAAVLSLPADESARSLIPLLNDKEEFVRQQAAYALGQAGSELAVAALLERLTDKLDSVRGASAVALGQIKDDTAVTSLAAILYPPSGATSSKKNKSKLEQNPFVLRAAARALGQIGDRAGLPALIQVLQDEKAEVDVRREAAVALGAIADQAAIPALRSVTMAADPYLSQAAYEAISKISRAHNTGGK